MCRCLFAEGSGHSRSITLCLCIQTLRYGHNENCELCLIARSEGWKAICLASLEQFREGRWKTVPRHPQRELTFPQCNLPAGVKPSTHTHQLSGAGWTQSTGAAQWELIYLCFVCHHRCLQIKYPSAEICTGDRSVCSRLGAPLHNPCTHFF